LNNGKRLREKGRKVMRGREREEIEKRETSF
jgi:hypothetical protein